MSVKPLPAPLTVNTVRVVLAVEAAEPVACLSLELLIKDALPGFPSAIADFPPGGGPGCMQEEPEAEAAAEPERGHGRAGPGLREVLPGASAGTSLRSAVPSFFLDQVVLSTLLPDSVLTGREPVFRGVTHL